MTRDDFLQDPKVQLQGYMGNFDVLELGILVFTHETCGSSVSVQSEKFTDLYKGEIMQTRAMGSIECPEYCLHFDDFRKCDTACECAYIRDILQIVKNWEKH